MQRAATAVMWEADCRGTPLHWPAALYCAVEASIPGSQYSVARFPYNKTCAKSWPLVNTSKSHIALNRPTLWRDSHGSSRLYVRAPLPL